MILLALAAQPGDAGAAKSVRSLIAPAKVCPNVSGFSHEARARKSIICLTNFARKRRGLKPYRKNSKLNFSSKRKGGDILRCNSFSHQACGRDFGYWIDRSGYSKSCSAIGENIAWGIGKLGSSREIFNAWMRSSGHRRAILNRAYRNFGIGLRTGHLSGVSGAHVWVQHFGNRC